ncbi:MAG: single-stranded DNA-binding protein [Alphaproteobacteria bacterium]|nr:single-stranded DNA-binding protein [Alphaproteobacteria bacterium]
MFNKIFLMGNLGANPELLVTQGGKKMARFSFATSFSWKDDVNDWHEHTDWHNVVVYRESTAYRVKRDLKKGDKVWVEGKLTYRRIEDRWGKYHRIPYIVISGPHGWVELLQSRNPQPEDVDVSEFEYTPEDNSEDNPEYLDEGSSEFLDEDFQSNQ